MAVWWHALFVVALLGLTGKPLIDHMSICFIKAYPVSECYAWTELNATRNVSLKSTKFDKQFYPRPVLAFGYCHRLRLCVCPCVCVCQSLACPRDNLGPVQARIAKFGPKMQKTLVTVPIVLGGNWPWPSRSNLTSKSEFTPFWACPDHNSSPIQVRITKFGPEVENSLVKVPIILGSNWPQIWFKQSNFSIKLICAVFVNI